MTAVDFQKNSCLPLNGQKGFSKILSLFYAGSNLKRKTLQCSVFLCKSDICENSASQVIGEISLGNANVFSTI